jgi:hypothetical protein
MRTLELTRSQFVAWLAERDKTPSASLPTETRYGHDKIELVWFDGISDDHDPIIAVRAEEMRDFLAFVSTYVGTYVPFTAFWRVVPRELLRDLPIYQKPLSSKVINALIGIVVCDAASTQSTAASPRVGDISVQACLATLSYVAAQALVAGYDVHIINAALTRWFAVRDELQQGAAVKARQDQLERFWAIVAAALVRIPAGEEWMQEAAVFEFVAAVSNNGGVATSYDWSRLNSILPGAEVLARGASLPREDKARLLEGFVSTLGPSQSSLVHGMVLGYLASQLADGSLNYLGVASRFVDRFPLSVLWFGLFSGLNPDNDIQRAGDCLGRRISRRLQNVASERDTIHADFSYEEFVLLLREGRVGRVRTETGSVVEVELLPWVNGRFRVTRPAPKVAEPAFNPGAAAEALRRIMSQAQAALRELEKQPLPETRELFDEKKPSTSSKKPVKRKIFR